MQPDAVKSTRPEPAGLVIHGAARYDVLVWLFTLGGERRFREKILRLAGLHEGEAVLDVGCGTGTLALLAKRQVGAGGVVHGVDASPEMIARAQEKARRAKVEISFLEAAIQKLPLADASVDIVLSTLMMHHLPRKARPEIAREIRRVLKPGGRLLVVDFAKPAPGKRSLMDRLHRHGFIKLDDLIPDLEAAGLALVRSAAVGERNLHYVLAAAGPSIIPLRDQNEGAAGQHDHVEGNEGHTHRQGAGRGHGPLVLGLGVLALLVLLAMHTELALTAYRAVSDLKLGPLFYAVIAVVMLIGVIVHVFGARLIARLVGARADQFEAD